jgi:predicted Zn-dependent protease
VTRGLLAEAESTDEIAGVLAHEIEHVTQRHVLAGFLRDAFLSGLWAVTAGDYAGMMVVDPSTAYRVASLEFSRDDEASADKGAVARLHQAGFDHAGLARFFERMIAVTDATPAWLSTHPSSKERVRALRSFASLDQADHDDSLLPTFRHACRAPDAGESAED